MWYCGEYISDKEECLRLCIDDIGPAYWNNTDLKNLSKDFFREFREKMEWRDDFGGLTRVALYVWQKFGDKFLDEMSFDAVREKKK